MKKVFKYLVSVLLYGGIGAGIGAVVSLALYVLGVVLEICKCTYDTCVCFCTCDENVYDSLLPFMWSVQSFLKCLIFCAICGFIVGGIYGIVIRSQERSEEFKNAGYTYKNSAPEKYKSISDDIDELSEE